jgi:hypothetical protein
MPGKKPGDEYEWLSVQLPSENRGCGTGTGVWPTCAGPVRSSLEQPLEQELLSVTHKRHLLVDYQNVLLK